MAYQHFFSRVPAKVSMFEKADSFDTFAKSEAITKEYIMQNLMPLCNLRLSNAELNMIRDGNFSYSYCQFQSKQNDLIQSTITYIPLDYTMVRSSYMIHSLIYTNEEKQKIIEQSRNALFNSKLFTKSMDSFDVTNYDSKPIYDLDQLLVSQARYEENDDFINKYDETTVKRLIYAFLTTLSNKGKNVYITFDSDLKSFSQKSLDFINSFTKVFPYCLKDKFSFITFLSDCSRYTNLIKIRFVPREFLTVMANKAYIFDLNSQLDDGIRDEEYDIKQEEVEFIYSLFKMKNLREKFLSFYAYIAQNNKELDNFDYKDFSNIISLFKATCEEFDSINTLFDKDVYNLIVIYEQYRDYIKEKDRCEILKIIQKYNISRTPIPQSTFSKLSKIYQNELPKCKMQVMQIILEMMICNVMRDRLFAFIKANYSKEPFKNRTNICTQLSQIFYGGFLQNQIITLFINHFETETDEIKKLILEKFLLAIRTSEIQEKLFEFFNKYYQTFSLKEKDMIYTTFYEMLEEDDELSKKIILFIDDHIHLDTISYKVKIENNLIRLIEENEKKKNKFLVTLIYKNTNVLDKIILKKIFTIWQTKGTFTRYLTYLETLSFTNLSHEIIKVWICAYDMETPTQKKFTEKIIECLNNLKSIKIYNVIDFDQTINETILNKNYRKLNGIYNMYYDNIDRFYQTFKNTFINTFVKEHLFECLNPKLKEDGLSYIIDFSLKNPFIKESEYYPIIMLTSDVVKYIKESQNKEALELICNKQIKKNIKRIVLDSIKMNLQEFETRCYTLDSLSQTAVFIAAIYIYLENDTNDFNALYEYVYNRKKDYLQVNKMSLSEYNKEEVNIYSLASLFALENICLYIRAFTKVCTNTNEIDKIYSNDGILLIIDKVIDNIDKNGKKKLLKIIEDVKFYDTKLAFILDEAYNKNKKKNSKSFFARIFNK